MMRRHEEEEIGSESLNTRNYQYHRKEVSIIQCRVGHRMNFMLDNSFATFSCDQTRAHNKTPDVITPTEILFNKTNVKFINTFGVT